jgi:hypothetical protein
MRGTICFGRTVVRNRVINPIALSRSLDSQHGRSPGRARANYGARKDC